MTKAASLSSSLLAPKGGAEPAALPPQSRSRLKLAPIQTACNAGAADRPAKAGAAKLAIAGVAQPKIDNTGRVRISVRLDPTDHLRLKLVSAHIGLSCQEILEQALAHYLEEAAPNMVAGQCACLDQLRAMAD